MFENLISFKTIYTKNNQDSIKYASSNYYGAKEIGPTVKQIFVTYNEI